MNPEYDNHRDDNISQDMKRNLSQKLEILGYKNIIEQSRIIAVEDQILSDLRTYKVKYRNSFAYKLNT